MLRNRLRRMPQTECCDDRIEHHAGVTHPEHAVFVFTNITLGWLRLPTPRLGSAPRWTRTINPLIKSQLLCQLS